MNSATNLSTDFLVITDGFFDNFWSSILLTDF